MNKQNLQKLADYLKAGKFSVPFDMAANILRRDDNGDVISACAVGQAFSIFPIVGNESVGKFLERIFEPKITILDTLFGTGDIDKMGYIGSIDWAKIDNTPQAAAERIQNVIDDTVPSDWREVVLEQLQNQEV